jgi:hypothetical protein
VLPTSEYIMCFILLSFLVRIPLTS